MGGAMAVAVAVESVAACERLGWRMGTRSRVHRNCNNNFSSSSYNNSSNRGNNSRNNNGKAVVPVLLKVRQLQRSMTTSPNDGDARWRGTVRGMTFIILAGNSGVFEVRIFSFSFFLALSYASQASFISLSLSLSSSSFLVDRIVYQHVLYLHRMAAVYPLLIFSHLSRVWFRFVESRRLLPYSSFVLPLPLFITPTLIVTHHKHVGLVLSHICTTKSIIVYIIFRFAFSFFFLFVLVPFGFLRLFCDGPINTKELHTPFS
jgi:hypothetical protein